VAEYDLVITDIDMPRMNGFELIEQMKADVGLKDIPIIVVSYKDRETDRQRGLDLGANEYLTKSSFQDDTMLNAVKLLIGDAKPGRE
jgi:two-component system sensor histidine kinase and response regulator WspE